MLYPRTKNRPNVDGRVSPKAMFIFFLANAFGFILVAYFCKSFGFDFITSYFGNYWFILIL